MVVEVIKLLYSVRILIFSLGFLLFILRILRLVLLTTCAQKVRKPQNSLTCDWTNDTELVTGWTNKYKFTQASSAKYNRVQWFSTLTAKGTNKRIC